MAENNVKKMASLLHQGATMLDQYCPQCGKILFRLPTGVIYCPVCDKEIKIIKNTDSAKSEMKSNSNSNISQILFENDNDRGIDLTFADVNNQIVKQIKILLNRMNDTHDMDLFAKISINIERLIDILHKLRNLK